MIIKKIMKRSRPGSNVQKSRKVEDIQKRRIFVSPSSPKKSSSGGSNVEVTRRSFVNATIKSDEDDDDDVTFVEEVRRTSSWVKTEFLGSGSYGSVYLATSVNVNHNQVVAIKSAEISRAASLMGEKRILTRLSSPFVVHCYGDEIAREENVFGEEITSYNLILEYCSGKSIGDLIVTMGGGGLWEEHVKYFARDILIGLSHVHDQNIIHCDIKPDNILLTATENSWLRPNGFSAKLGDFGLAVERGNGPGYRRGTKWYMAPELMSRGIVDFAVDIWAFGCTVLEMLTGEVAWAEHGDLCLGDMVDLIGRSDFIPYIPDWFSLDAYDFLTRCLVREPWLRWGIDDLMKHPFLDMELKESDNAFFFV